MSIKRTTIFFLKKSKIIYILLEKINGILLKLKYEELFFYIRKKNLEQLHNGF